MALIAYLAVEGAAGDGRSDETGGAESGSRARVSRDVICALLWPEQNQSQARQALRTTLAALREVLPTETLIGNRDTLALTVDSSAGIGVDVWEYSRLRGSIRPEVLDGTQQPLPAELEAAWSAAGLYRAEFMAGFYVTGAAEFDSWQSMRQHEFERMQHDLLWLLAQSAIDDERSQDALEWTGRLLELDPANEEVHREIMLLHHEMGDRSGALRQFDLCRKIIRQEIDRDPEKQTVELADEIRSSSESVRRFARRQSARDTDQNGADQEDTGNAPLTQSGAAAARGHLDLSAADRIRVTTLVSAAVELADPDFDIREDRSHRAVADFRRGAIATAQSVEGITLSETPEGVVVAFGAIVGHDDDPERAAGFGEEVSGLARRLGLALRVAIRTGFVSVGANPTRQAGTHALDVIGGAVTRLARQVARTPLGRVSLCRVTARALESRGSLEITPMDGSDALLVDRWRPDATDGATFSAGASLGLPGGGPAFVGRRSEIEQLLGLLEENAEGVGGVAVVSGAAGIGKSALLAELRRRSRTLPLQWHFGSCRERFQRQAYGAIGPIITSLMERIAGGDRADLPAAVVRRMLVSGGVTPADATSVRGALERLAGTAGGGTLRVLGVGGDDQFRRELGKAFRGVLRCLSGEHVAIIVEDVHWADPQSKAMLLECAHATREQPLTLIVTLRQEDAGGTSWNPDRLLGAGGQASVSLELRRLSRSESTALLTMAAPKMSDANRIGNVLEKAGGNPLFIRELAAHLAVDESLTSIPVEIHRIVQRRLDRMEAGLRLVVTAAAVLGIDVETDILATAVRTVSPNLVLDPVADVPRLCETSILREFDAPAVSEPGKDGFPVERLEFTHALVHESIYAGIKAEARANLHCAAALAIEALRPHELSARTTELAFHWCQTDNHLKAAYYLELQADRARMVFDLDSAVRGYELALERLGDTAGAGQKRRLNLKLATCHGLDLRFPEQRAAYLHAFAHREADERPGSRDARIRIGSDLSGFGLHPISEWDVPSSKLHRQIYRPLVRFTPDLMPLPDAAESWEVSPDGREYRFHLRPGIRWSDGAPVVADDFVAAMEARGVPDCALVHASRVRTEMNGWREVVGGMRKWQFRASGDDVIELRCEYPSPYVLQFFGQSHVSGIPSHLLSGLGQSWRDPHRCAYSGAFSVAAMDPGRMVRLEANPGYGNQFPGNLAQVDVLHHQPGGGIDPFVDGEVDVLAFLSYDEVRLAVERCPDELVGIPSNSRGGVHIHDRHPMLRSQGVRQALAMAVDRERICAEAMHGLATPAFGGAISPCVQGHASVGGFRFEPEEARALIRGAVGGRELKTVSFTVLTGEPSGPQARMIVDTWKEVLGVTAELEVLPRQDFIARAVQPDESDIVIGHVRESMLDPLDSLGPFITSAKGSVRSPAEDRTQEVASSALEGADRYLAAIRRIDLAKLRQAWSFPFCYDAGFILCRPWVRNLRWFPEEMMGLEEVVVVHH